MEIRFSKILSYILHPVFIPLYALLLLFQQQALFAWEISPQIKWFMLATVGIVCILIPLLFILLSYRSEAISDLHMSNRKERSMPLILMIVVYGFMYYFLRRFTIETFFVNFFLAITLNVFILFVINFFYKISLHMSGIGGLLALFISVFIQFQIHNPHLLASIILFSGLLAYARMRYGSHQIGEVYTGFLVGFATVFLMIHPWM